VAVRIRMKKLGRTHRPFFRICAIDGREPRDGRVIEELGTYDPMIPETDARAVFDAERVDYWLSVGAQPSHKVGVLIRKYGTGGTHVDAQKEALDRLAARRNQPVEVTAPPAPPEPEPEPEPEPAAETPEGESAEAEGSEEAQTAEAAAEEPKAEAAEGGEESTEEKKEGES